MPYKKKSSKYDRYNKRVSSGLTTAYKALKVAKLTRDMLNVEYKVKNNQVTGAAMSTTAVLNTIVATAQGTSDTTREGNQIKVTAINFKYYGQQSSSATVSAARVMIVLDKQCNGALPTINDILFDSTVDDAIVSPNNLVNKYRFKTLYNKVHLMSSSGNRMFKGQFNKKCNIPIRYSGSTSGVGTISSNNIIVIYFSDEGADRPAITYSCRVRYVDN